MPNVSSVPGLPSAAASLESLASPDTPTSPTLHLSPADPSSRVSANSPGGPNAANGGLDEGVAAVRELADALLVEVRHAVIGLDHSAKLLLTALLAGGHVLLEEVPGTGKTTLAKAVARALGLSFARLQCTPDLLPSDITGLYWFNQQMGTFEFRSGPVFAHILLADELNRATPRTQSALLEAMAEGQVTIEGTTHQLPVPFLVIATQNPVEIEGTFPLPEAQLDRFLMRVKLGYPDEAAEHAILLAHAGRNALADVQQVVAGPEALAAAQASVARVHVSAVVRGYIVHLTRASRDVAGVELGASPRGTLALYRAAQAWAALHGRSYVLPDDVQQLAPAVLAHRLMLEASWLVRGGQAADLIDELLLAVPVPVEG